MLDDQCRKVGTIELMFIFTTLISSILVSFVPYHISDSTWLANGSLLIAAGHQMYLYGQTPSGPESETSSDGPFEHVALQNGPLIDYHPQMLLQCLLWGEACHSAL